MPELAARVRAFAQRYGSDTDPELLVEAYRMHFVNREPAMIAFAGLAESGIVAHAFIQTEVWGTTKIANVTQFESSSRVPAAEMRKAYGAILGWAKTQGIEELQAMALGGSRARLFERAYGFRLHRVVLRRPLFSSPSAPKP
jgi:hypothetical protein